MIKLLLKKYEAQAALLREEILTYGRNPVGVGEHIDYVEPLESKIAEYDKYLSLIEATKTLIEG